MKRALLSAVLLALTLPVTIVALTSLAQSPPAIAGTTPSTVVNTTDTVITLSGQHFAGNARGTDQWDLTSVWRLPFVRAGHTAIYDAANHRLVAFGGWNGRTFSNDLWALDMTAGSEAWTQIQGAAMPPQARGQHSAIYDAANERMIVFGGHNRYHNFNDVWALDLTPGAETWSRISPAEPAVPILPRRWHSAIYDATNGRMIVFGGSGGGTQLNDVWALDLTPGSEAWSQLAPAGGPPAARSQHTAVYDAAHELMILFGGATMAGLSNDAWALNLTPGSESWVQLSPAGTPPVARRGHTAIYDGPHSRMLVFGGLGGSGFRNDLWALALTPGSVAWTQPSTTGGPPGTRAWHSVTNDQGTGRLLVLGGRGMGTLQGETHWSLDLGTLAWSTLGVTLPGAELTGLAEGGAQVPTQFLRLPTASLAIEDALSGTPVHLMPGMEVWFVVYLSASSSAFKDDVDVTLTIDAGEDQNPDLLLEVVEVGTRPDDLGEVTWGTLSHPAIGSYAINDVDLATRYMWGVVPYYAIQVIFKANVLGTADAELGFTATATYPHSQLPFVEYDASDVGTAHIWRDPQVWMVTNRSGLFSKYPDDRDGVQDLLIELYEQAEASGRSAVILYADRYLPSLTTWDNTTVNYESETTANLVADDLADWLSSWIVGWDPPTPAHPTYLVLVGDDNVIPFYRKADYDLWLWDARSQTYYDASEEHIDRCYDLEPLCDELVSNDFYWTDNPYGDANYDSFYPDWEDGDLEASVGRIVGGSVQDMKQALQNSALGPNPQATRAIIASGNIDISTGEPDCFDWWVQGRDADTVIRQELGYTVDTTLIDNDPTKTTVVNEMEQGFAIAAFAHHGRAYKWECPGGTGPDWWNTRWGADLVSYEVPLYDPNMADNRPFFFFNACRVGLSYSSGWDDSFNPEDSPYAYDDTMVYALNNWGASGVVASAGFVYIMSANNETSTGEDLSRDFWIQAAAEGRSDPLGWALRQAKAAFPVVDAFDQKTVQTFTYFGLPWMRLADHNTTRRAATVSPDHETSGLWSLPTLERALGPNEVQASFVLEANIDASTYVISPTVDGFDLIEVDGLSQRTQNGRPVLPQATLELVLPLSATISSLVFTPTQDVKLPDLGIPTAVLSADLGDEGTGGHAPTPDDLYPVTATVVSRLLDSYQLARVYVVPVTYDATADQATLYRSVDVGVHYDTPQTLALTHFEPDQDRYAPGETIGTRSQLVSVGDTTETVTATLILQDVQGQIVGFQGSGPFDVPAGGSYDLDLDWTGPLEADLYWLRLLVWQGGQVIAGAGREILVSSGAITELAVPGRLQPGEEGAFELTFDNLGDSATIAVASLAIYDTDDNLIEFLEPQSTAIASGGSGTLTFFWTPEELGAYVASAVIMAGGQEYGPVSEGFAIKRTVYLPLVLRNHQD